MQSVIQKKSCGSVKTFWLNKELLHARIKTAVRKILQERKEIEDLVMFGSCAENKISVASDVDILIIVKDSEKNFIDRQLDYKDYFGNVGINVDLFVYTRKEVNKHIPFVEKALAKGIHFSLDTTKEGVV